MHLAYNYKNIGILISFALLLWGWIFLDGITTAYRVWVVSEIFNHCLFILPCAMYFMYRKRYELIQTTFTPTLLPFLVLIPCLFVQLFGLVGDIKVLMHMATFTALPVLIWSLIGHQAAKVIAFPLLFILFCVPIGEQLVPHLQELTTDIAVPLLELTGVPIFRNGLYLDIPEGQFLVAEACSGISFLISSIVFGFFYSYISFNSFKKRAIFVVLSVLVPLLANALRVYGIVLTGHLSNMEHAVGTDHLVYGGVFFGIVLFILIIIGERFRDKVPAPLGKNDIDTSLIKTDKYSTLPFVAFLALALVQQIWFYQVTHQPTDTVLNPASANANTAIAFNQTRIENWQPQFKSADSQISGKFESDLVIDAYVFYYHGSGSKGELISSAHRLFDSQRWSLAKNQTVNINGQPTTLSEVAGTRGQRRYILHWYEIAGRQFNSSAKAKLYQAYLLMFGQDASGAKILLSVPQSNEAKAQLISAIEQYQNEIRFTLYDAL